MRARLKPLSQQRIVITGASSGIGLATARLAVDRGAAVVLAARNEAALNDIAASLRARSGRVAVCAADVAEPADVERIAETADRAFGGFDSWVNDAVAAVYGKLTEIPIEDHRRVFEVGYWGTVQGALVAARHLRGRGGAIINLGSVLSERAVNAQGPYCAMKHAVRGFTDALRAELEAEGAGISVTLIKPTGMDTPFPEHARNYMGRPARIPPPVYDPRLSARAILFACETPRRELTVGGSGLIISKLGNLFPRMFDLGLEVAGERSQQTDQLPPAERVDNLYAPRADGAVESAQDLHVRRTSLWLEAQMHPLLTAAMIGSLGFAVAAAPLRRGVARLS